MTDIIGRKGKNNESLIPNGQKVRGRVIEVKMSEKFQNSVNILVEFPQFKYRSDDGSREFAKRAFYSIPLIWRPGNRAGQLYRTLEGRFPDDEGGLNWTRLLLDREVDCIFEIYFDKNTSEIKGQRIRWMGGVSLNQPKQAPLPVGGLSPDDELGV